MRWRVALLQLAVIPGDPEANRARASAFLRRLPPGTDVVALPELWTTGYGLDPLAERCEPEDGPTARLLADAARREGIALVGGSVATAAGGRVYNQVTAYNRMGERVGRARKVHLFRPMGEDGRFAGGGAPELFALDGVPCGAIVCYDLRFPELARALTLAGLRFLFVPALWPAERIAHWRALLVARAIENQCFVAGVNGAGGAGAGAEAAAGRAGGRSLLVDPWGRVLAEGGEGEEWVTAAVELDAVEAVRRALPALADRVPEAYVAKGVGAGAAQV